jgi:hypothetical protein
MQTAGTRPENIPRGECLRLMATAGVGRIIYTRQALPAVELVSFALDRGDLVVHLLQAAARPPASAGT